MLGSNDSWSQTAIFISQFSSRQVQKEKQKTKKQLKCIPVAFWCWLKLNSADFLHIYKL